VTRHAIVLALIAGLCAAVAEPSQQPEDPAPDRDVRVRSRVSRTAVWVGDPVELVVEFVCPPQVDVIPEDLARDKLKLEGLEVVSSSFERLVSAGESSQAGLPAEGPAKAGASPESGGVATHRFRYQLATYETRLDTLRIASWPVRYYVRRAGERPEDVSPAGEVQVLGATIARRSTIPDELAGLDPRTSAVLTDAPGWLNASRPIGIGLIVLAAAPLAIWTAAVIARVRSRTARPRARTVRAQARSALEEVRAIDVQNEASRREAYGRLDKAVRQHLADTRGIPAHAMTPGEVAARLQAAGSPQADDAAQLLTECERARYAPPNRLPSADRFGSALDTAQRIFDRSAA
jgi:hypothetical protein